MKKHLVVWGAVVLTLSLGFSFATLAWTRGEGVWEYGEYEHEGGEGGEYAFWRGGADIPAARDKRYVSECSACHFAYPPGLLPARSWARIMRTLDDHFSENAELDEPARAAIERYLRENAADRKSHRFSRGILRSIPEGEAPLRFTETAFFRYRHHEVPARMVSGNPKVRSFANCAACHTGAGSGRFDEHGVRIPGFGQWDD